MTKAQKVWLGIFLAMFIVPEVLWSPVFNEIYAFFMPLQGGSVQIFRPSFLTHIDNIDSLSSILFIQSVGVFLSFIYLIITRKQFQNKLLLWIVAAILLLLALISFAVFSMSMSLRNIGF